MKEYFTRYIIYWLIFVLFMIGPYGMIFKKNLLKKLMAMNIMQVAVILFFLVLGLKTNGSIPILDSGIIGIDNYINPIPHALMLTAIVVSLATTGVSLALLLLIQRRYGALEEDELLRRMNK
ncbi:MAG: cation:proton antiporter subunit C [Clostridia bacterium]|nr:cation:proton antiporter subunit C [Clostridia bacterium]MDD4047417.1 cation:proton antiporter subunit C [Clostridia bacterium]